MTLALGMLAGGVYLIGQDSASPSLQGPDDRKVQVFVLAFLLAELSR